MIDEKLFSLFKERYHSEIERQYILRRSITIPISFISITLTIMMFLFSYSYVLSGDMISIICTTLIFLSFTCSLLSIFILMLAVFGYSYKYMPMPSEILNYKIDLEKFYNNSPESEHIADKIIRENISIDG